MMKGFAFRYAKLLKLREQKLDEARARVREAQQAIEKLDVLCEQLRAERQQLRQPAMGLLAMGQMLDISRYAIQTEAQLKTLHEQRHQLETEWNRRQQTAHDALAEVKQMERLREQQADAFAAEQAKKEQELLDEFAIMHRRTNRTPS